MSIESLAKEFEVSESAVQSALNGLDPTALTAVEKAALRAAVSPGKLSQPKGSTPVAKAPTGKPAALVGGDFTPVAAAVPADETASDKKAELLAQIEAI